MITSIQLSTKTKSKLEKLKEPGQTYEQVIDTLLTHNKIHLRNKLKEGYISQHNLLKQVHHEWEHADTSW